MAALEASLPAAYDRDVDKDDPDADPQSESTNVDDVEKAASHEAAPSTAEPLPFDWTADPANPYNWPGRRKWAQVAVIASIGFVTSVGTSIISPATFAIRADFGLHSTTVALLPFSFYVLALALGPVVGGPLSETVGRLPMLAVGTPLGLLFTVGAALCPASSLAGLCILRFLAGFVLGPSLAIASGILTETFRPVERGLPSAVFIVTPFLGPGMGPVLGAFAMRKGWPWTQWTLVFFAAFSLILIALFGRETYHPIVRRRRLRQLGLANHAAEPPPAPFSAQLRLFLSVGLLRPISMMLTEPIVGLTCLYVACEFATLFTFFAAVPYVFESFYGFDREESGLVFLSIVVGCLLGLVTIISCDLFIYRRRLVPRFPPHQVPPEHRLYAAMLGSLGMPVSLFWFAWTADRHAHWAAPVVAIVPFAWGNICIFISLMQYLGDTYSGSIVASAGSANSLARYSLAAAFPLFTLQMYRRLGIGWASSLLGFISVALLPVPWLFFRYGPAIRKRSRY